MVRRIERPRSPRLSEFLSESGAGCDRFILCDSGAGANVTSEDKITLEPFAPHAAAGHFETNRSQELGNTPAAASMLPCLDLNPLKLRLCERVLGPGKNVLGETGYVDFYVIRARRAITSNEVIDGAELNSLKGGVDFLVRFDFCAFPERERAPRH